MSVISHHGNFASGTDDGNGRCALCCRLSPIALADPGGVLKPRDRLHRIGGLKDRSQRLAELVPILSKRQSQHWLRFHLGVRL